MGLNKSICLILLALFLIACGTQSPVLADYNKALLELEKNIQQCSNSEKAVITGDKAQSVDENAMRIALTYFYVKNSQACTKNKQEILLSAIEKIEGAKDISELIRFNASHLKTIFIDDKKKLNIEKEKFDALSIETKQHLNALDVSNRSFKADLAVEYYLAE